MKITKSLLCASMLLASTAALAAPRDLAGGSKATAWNSTSTSVCTVREIFVNGEAYI
ncbi:MAG: hypothetical protein K2W91_11450 [Novosphingobium sp.]|nr:hypothetical protein [Novosphingobium sp.]